MKTRRSFLTTLNLSSTTVVLYIGWGYCSNKLKRINPNVALSSCHGLACRAAVHGHQWTAGQMFAGLRTAVFLPPSDKYTLIPTGVLQRGPVTSLDLRILIFSLIFVQFGRLFRQRSVVTLPPTPNLLSPMLTHTQLLVLKYFFFKTVIPAKLLFSLNKLN